MQPKIEMSSSQKRLQVAIQIIGWGIMFVIPLFFSPEGDRRISLVHYIEYVFVPISFMVVFYLNYYYFIDRYLYSKRLLRLIVVNAIIIAVVVYGLHLLHEFFFSMYVGEVGHVPKPMKDLPGKTMFIFRDAMVMSLTAGLAVAVKMTGNWYSTEYERKELEKAKSEAELDNLKSQLNPHFLFNTLNNIYSLIAIDATRAQDAVHGLSHLLRYVLYENNQTLVPLDKEVKFIRSYIELMSMRISSNFHSKVNLPEEGNVMIAPMLLITLIENAFKHGVSNTQSCFINVDLSIDKGRVLTFTVINSNYAVASDGSVSGIGIDNMRKRLDLIYPGRYTLTLENLGQTFMSQLTIKLNSDEC
ncbi:sensor histidine kinase [uncultured Acetobacteroides sp.]|uniref:sensor histidine kinase n=1 Tax=uncultured Acetobacteroides sp. TaxID=1760811 RepID=UPI0029F4B9DB|nr:sensor histidine kinase [uncultured Acetobacteroides sp.]